MHWNIFNRDEGTELTRRCVHYKSSYPIAIRYDTIGFDSFLLDMFQCSNYMLLRVQVEFWMFQIWKNNAIYVIGTWLFLYDTWLS